jgi:hypothetical protein
MKQHYDAEVKKLKSEHELALYYLRQDHETQLKRKERVIETVSEHRTDRQSSVMADKGGDDDGIHVIEQTY